MLSFFSVIWAEAQLRNLRPPVPVAQEAQFLLTASDAAISSREKSRIEAHASSNLFFDTLDHSTKCSHTQRTFSMSLSSNLLRSVHSDDIDRMQAMVSVVKKTAATIYAELLSDVSSRHAMTRIRVHASSSFFF